MANALIAETGSDIDRTVSKLLRKRPVSAGNRSDYTVLAFQLENTAKRLRERAARAAAQGEGRSFSE